MAASEKASKHTHAHAQCTHATVGLAQGCPNQTVLIMDGTGWAISRPDCKDSLRKHPQGDMHMVAARLGFERAMVIIGWATSHPDCMDSLRIPHLLEGWFLARKAAWALSGCMAIDSADYCMLTHRTLLFLSSNCNNTQL